MKATVIQEIPIYKSSETEIVKKILAGEKELYEILLRRNNQKLYRVIRSYLSDRDSINDVMQDTYLKAYEKLHQFKQESQFATWLIRIGINEALSRIKSNNKYVGLYEESNNLDDPKILKLPTVSTSNPEKDMINREVAHIIETVIDKLESKYKSVYIMKEVEEMSIADIAECLELSQSNVKVRLHRAKEKVQKQLYQLSINKNVFEFGFSKCDLLVKQVMAKIL